MAVTGVKLGFGTLLRRETSPGSGTYETIAEVQQVGSPTQERSEVEATHMESPNTSREFIPGLGEVGEVNATSNFRPDDATQNATTGIIADYIASTTRSYRIVYDQYPGDPTITFSAFVKSYGSIEATVDDRLSMPFVLRLTASPVWS